LSQITTSRNPSRAGLDEFAVNASRMTGFGPVNAVGALAKPIPTVLDEAESEFA
jgi:hypothetical protein